MVKNISQIFGLAVPFFRISVHDMGYFPFRFRLIGNFNEKIANIENKNSRLVGK